MTSQPGKEIITMHILPSVSITKVSQTMKFSQLTQYNMRNIFLEKSSIKYGGETSPRSIIKNQN